MALGKKKREALAFKNPNRAWVMAEFQKLSDEWEDWEKCCQTIKDHPYDRNTQSEVFADGVENMERHEILRTKTLTFLDNNIQGHNFMLSNVYEEPFESDDLRLRVKVPHRTRVLGVLMASLEYALVPDGFWTERGKAFAKAIANAPDKIIAEVAARWLRNPFGSD